ncbi:DUF6550 family protein [Caproicibacter fermentans]|uniref:Uncharacterized protein n=1 Tax=Caproicibacter fermentans TaxID=2576756 RepID=A0A7G8TD41_9FIRM|nr:DUF6550 family protein [Caproicibacter fermentans]QNK41532.1 hypothetical protein HCR03_04520 [Caproicibacter fermentans]
MKKIALTPKATKIALVTGIFLICGGVLAVVLNNANAQVQTTDREISSSSAVSSSDAPEISIAGINSEDSISHTVSETTGTNSAFDPQKESSRSEPLTTSSKPTSKPPKPVVEGDSVNGSQPTNSVLTDKSHKPTYTSKPTITSRPSSSKPSTVSSSPTNGEKSNGKTYVNGWGWVDGTGGGTGSTASDMYEDGVKVGIMD